jgi:hypothetical protein
VSPLGAAAPRPSAAVPPTHAKRAQPPLRRTEWRARTVLACCWT